MTVYFKLFLPVGLCCATCTGLFAQTIQGTISESSGQPVPGAYVIATPQVTGGGATLTALSGANGAFRFSAVKPGNYALCVEAARTTLLNPCDWSQPIRVTVSASQAVSNVAIQLVQGSLLQVRINDPDGLTLATRGPGPMLVGIYTTASLFREIRRVTTDASGKTFSVTVPANAAVRLAIHSTALQITDSNGVQVNAAPSVSVPVAAIQAGAPVAYTITGPK